MHFEEFMNEGKSIDENELFETPCERQLILNGRAALGM